MFLIDWLPKKRVADFTSKEKEEDPFLKKNPMEYGVYSMNYSENKRE